MKKIFKYPMHIENSFTLTMPNGAKILKIENQGGFPQLWAEVHPDNEPQVRRFHCHGTGHDVPEDGREHVGSCLVDGFVWHFYEAPR